MSGKVYASKLSILLNYLVLILDVSCFETLYNYAVQS